MNIFLIEIKHFSHFSLIIILYSINETKRALLQIITYRENVPEKCKSVKEYPLGK